MTVANAGLREKDVVYWWKASPSSTVESVDR
jgi:hypothetical protein